MWRVIQYRWIKGSTQNFSNELGEFGRKKQAFGEIKAQLNSHTEMLVKHDFMDMELDDAFRDDNSITLYQSGEPIYYIRYDAEEIMTEPKKSKINLIKELEILLDKHSNCSHGDIELYIDIEKLVDKVTNGRGIQGNEQREEIKST